MAASRRGYRNSSDFACAAWRLHGQGVLGQRQLAAGEGDLPRGRRRAGRPATVDQVSEFATGLFGGQCAGPLLNIAFAGTFAGAVGP